MADSPVNAPDPFFHDVKAHGINNGQKNSRGGQNASAINHGAVRMSAISDPWRLCCPECGSHTLLAQSQGWLCRGCNTHLDKLKDKRDDRLRSKHELAQV